MKKIASICFISLSVLLFSCSKEYSDENGTGDNDQIVGIDCRISKIVYTDTATNTGLGSIAASINSQDAVTNIIKYDSVGRIIEFIANPFITNDTIHLNANEYFLVDFNNRIISLHGLSDPTDPLSPQFDASYFYNATGYLTSKLYAYTAAPGVPYKRVIYTYTNSNLLQMTETDLLTGDVTSNATLEYYTGIVPKRYLYIFPDEKMYAAYNQFYNFGERPYNAVKKITVRNYDPGNVIRDSAVSNFSTYIMSRDTYVFSVQMSGDAQAFIPALAGKLSFSYKCK